MGKEIVMNQMYKICIVVIGYNRPDSVNRLLKCIQDANYMGDCVDLVISIDKGALQSEIVEIAKEFNWRYGKKFIRAYSQRRGLRSHVLDCGDLTEHYDAVIALEDDITVSKDFYHYVSEALKQYSDDTRIAGISLYKHHTNQGVREFFEPEYNGYDGFLIQYAQSWGQCWTKAMWKGFRDWYVERKNTIFSSENEVFLNRIPENVKKWDSHSWLKYYIAYVVEKELFFLYPYHSLSTNHTEQGQHSKILCNDYQVSMSLGKSVYNFPTFEQAVKYDVFFERCDLVIPNMSKERVIIDLYGNKTDFSNADILISTKRHPYRIIETWKLKYHPQEVNCRIQEIGDGIFVYDLKDYSAIPKKNYLSIRIRYQTRSLVWQKLLPLSVNMFFEAIRRKFKR